MLNEPETEEFAEIIAAAAIRLVSAVSALETAIVIETKKGSAGGKLFDEFLIAARVEIIAFDETQFS